MARFPRWPDGSKSGGEREPLELGEDAIVAQRVGLHDPAARSHIVEEARSVVISEPPPAAPSAPPRRGRADPTLIIRDRRALEELREQIARDRQRQRRRRGLAVYLWSGIGALAFVAGGAIAFLATETGGSQPVATPVRASAALPVTAARAAAAVPAPRMQPVRAATTIESVQGRRALDSDAAVAGRSPAANASAAPPQSPPPTVRVDDLPVEPADSAR